MLCYSLYYDMSQNKCLQHNYIRTQNNTTIKTKAKTQLIQTDEQILADQRTSKMKYHLSNLH